MVTLEPKAKYRRGGRAQAGFKPPAKGGNGTKTKNRHKQNDREKARIKALQPKMVLVLLASGKKVIQRAS